MEENTSIEEFDLEQAALEFIEGPFRSGDNSGTEWLDRTIYHAKLKTDSEGREVRDGAGKPLLEVQAYAKVGMSLSPEMMKRALEIEKKFFKLNKRLREDEEAVGHKWKIPEREQNVLTIVRN
jgi:hypothetical protein